MNMKSGIYMWTSPSGKSYIGQSVNLQKRKCAFLCFGDIYGGQKINCARKKYNHKSLWDYKVLEYCDVDDLDEREEYYISLYNTINNGYNCESGGHENKIVSDESKHKMSEAKKGNHLTKEHKRKLSEAMKGKRCGENHPMYGRTGCDNPLSMPIVQLSIEGTFIREWSCTKEAEDITGIDSSNISKCCRGKRKSAGGFKWTNKNPTASEETMG